MTTQALGDSLDRALEFRKSVQSYSTWARDTFAGGDYAVSVHRRA